MTYFGLFWPVWLISIYGTYFDTKLSMFRLASSAMHPVLSAAYCLYRIYKYCHSTNSWEFSPLLNSDDLVSWESRLACPVTPLYLVNPCLFVVYDSVWQCMSVYDSVWPVYVSVRQCMTSVWPVYDQCMTFLWPVYDQCLTNVWPVYDQCMTTV